jgi:hypothetical protein
MAYSRGRRGSARRSYRRGSVSSRRQTFSAKQWGTFGLTTANQQIEPLNLLTMYQDALGSTGSVDVARCTVLGVRGWIAFYYGPETDASVDDEENPTGKRMGWGIRTMSSASALQIDSLAERQAVSPYREVAPANRTPNTSPEYDSWMWRRSRPIVPQPVVPDGTNPGIDPLATMWSYKFGISTSNMRKLSMGESLYLFGGINFDPGSGGDIRVFYELNTALARP